MPTSTAHNIPVIKCRRHKNFKDLMYRSTGMRKIKCQNAYFSKGDYLSLSENNLPDSIFSLKIGRGY